MEKLKTFQSSSLKFVVKGLLSSHLWEAFTTLPRYLRAFCTLLFGPWALSWFTSGPTSRSLPFFLAAWHCWKLSKSFLNRLKSRPSWEPESGKSSWCFRELGSFPSSQEMSQKPSCELNFRSLRALRGLQRIGYLRKLEDFLTARQRLGLCGKSWKLMLF